MTTESTIGTTPETLSQLMDGEWQDIDRSACVAGLCSDAALRARWARFHLARDAMKGEAVMPGLSLADRVRDAVADEPVYSNVVGIGTERPSVFAPITSASSMPTVAHAPESVPGDVPEAVPGPPGAIVPRSGRGARVQSAFAGFGIAATVALATLGGLSIWQGAPDAPAGSAGAGGAAGTLADASGSVGGAVLAPRLPAVELVGNSGSYWTSGAVDGDPVRSADEERLNGFLVQHLENAPSATREGLLPYSRLVGYDDRSVGAAR